MLRLQDMFEGRVGTGGILWVRNAVFLYLTNDLFIGLVIKTYGSYCVSIDCSLR